MIEKFSDMCIFLFQGTNVLLTLSVIFSIMIAIFFSFCITLKQSKQTLFALLISLSLLSGACALGLTSKGMREISLKDYHFLVNKTRQNPILNKALVHFINRNNNKITGVGFAVIKNKLSKLEREEFRKAVDKEKREARTIRFYR